MTANLTKFEWRDNAVRSADIADLQYRLDQVQLRQIAHRRRLILLLDGWTGAGQDLTLRRLAGSWDPCHVRTSCQAGGNFNGDGRHWLAPYWAELPNGGNTTMFVPGWYRGIIEQRMLSTMDGRSFARACDEINEFEAQQRDHGTHIIKLYFHMQSHRYASEVAHLQQDVWRRGQVDPLAIAVLDRRDDYVDVANDLFALTDTRWSPWHVIDGNDAELASLDALTMIVEAMETAFPADPPAGGDAVIPFLLPNDDE